MADRAHGGAPSSSEPGEVESTAGSALKVSSDRPDADTVVVTVAGEVDVATAPTLIQALDKALRDRPSCLVVDLHGVSFLGSAGLSALVEASRTGQAGTSLRVVADSPVTRRPMTLMGLDSVFTVCTTLESALAE